MIYFGFEKLLSYIVLNMLFNYCHFNIIRSSSSSLSSSSSPSILLSLLSIFNSKFFLSYLFIFQCLYSFKANNFVYSFEKVCGEYWSSKLNYKNGTFNSNDVDNDIKKLYFEKNVTEPTLCIYKFIANNNEKVRIKFDYFDIKSLAPDCAHEYVDVYINLNNENVNNYVDLNFLSRFCGWKKPNLLISYQNIILLAYHTDGKYRSSSFSGTFEFIDAEPYTKGKINKNTNKCEYEFKSINDKSGWIYSPTYPGTYPNHIDCTYSFIGQPNERISIYFYKISLHYGAEHCPYDAIKVYDVFVRTSQRSRNNISTTYRSLIGTYCGIKNNLTIYSTSSLMDIRFETLESIDNDEYADNETLITLRAGFKAYYQFSENFVNLSFITGIHVKGTNCDQRFISHGDSNGLIYSPNYPNYNQLNATCNYVFEGLNENEYFESVKLLFHTNPYSNSFDLYNNCIQNKAPYLYVNGTTKIINKKYCLTNEYLKEPKEIRSFNSLMILTYHSSYNHKPLGFIAQYNFFTEFGISGNRVFPNRTCLYLYDSKTNNNGHINSPRYPHNYPINTECLYIFKLNKNERLLFTFKDFSLAQKLADNSICPKQDDHLTIYQIYRNNDEILNDYNEYGTNNNNNNNNYINDDNNSDTIVNRYCGHTLPSPIISDNNVKNIKVHFYSNAQKYAHGFNLHYDYLKETECKYSFIGNSNISSGSIEITDKLQIENSHHCEWYITVEHGQSILFTFNNFNLEDEKCGRFVIRIYDLYASKTIKPYEYCINGEIKHFQIDSSRIKIELLTGHAFNIKSGKLIINWVSAYKDLEQCVNGIVCESNNTKYCINSSHYCDKTINCPDRSDEPIDCDLRYVKRSTFSLYQIIIAILSIIILILLLSMCLIYKYNAAKRKSKDKNRTEYIGQPVFYKYSPTNSMDYLEAAITSV